MNEVTVFDLWQAWPAAYRAMAHVESTVRRSGLDVGLYELVKVRTSQLHGCSYCTDLHLCEARKLGERDERLDALGTWRDAVAFTPRERAALALADAIAAIPEADVRAVVEEARRHFAEDELAQLVVGIVTMGAWNRLTIIGGPPHPGR
jgi:AhpD family alkylhydroperoxidase